MVPNDTRSVHWLEINAVAGNPCYGMAPGGTRSSTKGTIDFTARRLCRSPTREVLIAANCPIESGVGLAEERLHVASEDHPSLHGRPSRLLESRQIDVSVTVAGQDLLR